MTSFVVQRTELKERVDVIRNILSETRNTAVARETRGMAIVLLYACYERLLKSLVRVVLEDAKGFVQSNHKLSTKFKVFCVHDKLQGLVDASHHREIWTKDRGIALLNALDDRTACTLSPNVFPDSGDHMKSGQVLKVCSTLELGNPAPVLKEVWSRLDTVVVERNKVAHGAETPDSIGRRYSDLDILQLVALWELRWLEFIEMVEQAVNKPGYYGVRRYRRASGE